MKLVIFDLDGTLAESKQAIDEEMKGLLQQLLAKYSVAIITGGKYEQVKKQVVDKLDILALIGNLYLLPCNGTMMYYWNGSLWNKKYAYELNIKQKDLIDWAFNEARVKTEYKHSKKLWGSVLEDRHSQITFSMLGQQAPVEEKQAWNAKNSDKRQEIAGIMQDLLPDFEVRTGGLTSIDVTLRGFDKGFGVKKLLDYLKLSVEDAVFIGDALYEGGNDESVIKTRVKCVRIDSVEQTKEKICELLASS